MLQISWLIITLKQCDMIGCWKIQISLDSKLKRKEKRNNKTDRNWRAHSPSHQFVKQFTTDCIEQQTRGSSDQFEPQPKQTARCYDSLIIHYKTQEEKSNNNTKRRTKPFWVRMGRQSRIGRERLRVQIQKIQLKKEKKKEGKNNNNKPMGIIQRAASTHLQLADFIMAVRICSG